MKFNHTYLLVQLTIGLVIFNGTISGQTNFVKEFDLIPKTPEASAIIAYQDQPVNMYTGRAMINLPIGEISTGNLSDNISISYQTGGNKVNQIAEFVGLGWSLNAGSTITRKINGLPDEYKYDDLDVKGFLFLKDEYTYEDLVSPSFNYNWPSDPSNEFYDKLAYGCYDAEPDEFYFKIGEFSGKFLFDWDGQIVVISESDVKVELSGLLLGEEGYSFQNWILTDPFGNKYIFNTGDTELTENMSSNISIGCGLATSRLSFTSSWKVSEINSYNNIDLFYYNYEDYFYQQSWNGFETRTFRLSTGSNCSGSYSGDANFSQNSSKIYGKRLSRIQSNDGEYIDFNYLVDRTDISGLLEFNNFKRLESIDFGRGNYPYKSVEFQYLENSSRLMLESYYEVGNDGVSTPPYSFSYHSTFFPSINSQSVDWWGFHNGSTGVSLVPEGYYLSAAGNYVRVYGRDRSPVYQKTLSGMLQSYTIPTGGRIEYEYEQNEFSHINGDNSNLEEFILIDAGTQVNGVGDPDEPNVMQERSVDFEITESQQVSLRVSGVINQPCFNGRPRVYLNSADGSISYTYVLGPTSPPTPSGEQIVETYIFDLPAGNYTMTAAAMACFDIPDVVSGNISWVETTTETVLKKSVGGLRVAAKHVHDPFSGTTSSTYYKYHGIDPGTSSGVIYAEPLYNMYSKTYVFNFETTGPTSPPSECDYYLFTGSNKLSLEQTDGWHVGYHTVEEWYGANKEDGHAVYNYQSPIEFPDVLNTTIPFGSPASNNFKTGLLNSQATYDNNEKILEEKIIYYDYFSKDINRISLGRKINFNTNEDYTGFYLADLLGISLSELYGRWIEPIRSGYARMSLQTTITHEGDNSHTTTTTQTYDQNLHNLQSRILSGSNGVTDGTYYRYASDLNNTCLLDKHIVGVPLETLKDDIINPSSGQKIEFSYFSIDGLPIQNCNVNTETNIILPQTLYSWNGQWDNIIEVQKVNSEGKPITIQRQEFDFPETYTWDNNRLSSLSFLNHTQEWTYHGDSRLIHTYTTIDGQTQFFNYDGLQRLKKTRSRNDAIITDYIYNYGALNEITSSTSYSDDATVNTSRNTFDGLGRPLDNYINGELQKGRRYEKYGRIKTQTFMAGRWLNRILYERSPLNRVSQEIYPDGSRKRYLYLIHEGYSGVKIFDEKNNHKTILKDILGRTSIIIDALGGETRYVYTNWDEVDEITPPLGPKYEYTYNSRRLLETISTPGEGISTLRYDSKFRLSASMDPKGYIIGNVYDDYGRLYQTYLREDGALPDDGTSFSPLGSDQLLSENLYVNTQGNPQEDIGRLLQSSIKILDGSSSNMAVIDYTYDEYGRIINQSESFSLFGQSFTNTNTVNHAFLTHRDLPGRSISTLTNGTDNAQLGTFMGYDDFGRATSTGYKFGVSGPIYGAGLASSWSATYDFDRHGQMSYKHYWQNPSGSWYGEDYSYNSRGWLTSINSRPAGRSFDADFCGQPDGNVYQGGGIEEEVTFEELLALISEGESIHIEGTNVCPDNGGPGSGSDNPPIQETCQEDIVDSRISINLATGQPSDHPIPFQAPFGDVNSDVPVANIQLTRLEADWFTFNRGQGEEFIFLSRSYDLFLKDYTTDVVDTTHIEAEHTALESELENWAIGQGYSVPIIYISYSGKSIDIQFLDANIEFINIKVEQSWQGIIPHPVPSQSTILTETRFKELRFTNDNYRKIDCSSVAAKGTGNNGNSYVGNLQSPNLPFKFYEVTVENTGTTYKEFLLPSEIAGITDKYTITNQYTVTSPSQTFTLEKESGSVVVTGIAGLVDARDGTNDRLIKVDMPTAENGEATTIPGTEQFCEIYDLPTCTEEEQLEQLAQVDAILAGIDLDAVSYPYTLTLVMLCNGQTVWLPGDETTLSTLLTSGEVYYLDEVIANSANDLFHIVRKVTDALFSMDLEYEPNGNIESATWKSTYHLRRQYAYGYDELNRIASADYSILPSPGVPMPTYGQGFTADNFTYDALGNILTLRRYAQLAPNTEAELIDDLKYQYHGTLDPGEAAIPNQDLNARPDVSRLLFVDETGDNEFAKNHGFLPGDASSSDTYGYDDAGNLTTDPFKEITLTYNHLNLPREIDGMKIIYDASGNKRATIHPDGNVSLYINGMEFVNGVFESINLGDGRIYVESSSGPGRPTNLIAEYWHKDHLGNIRVAFTDQNGDRLVQLLDDGSGNPSEVNQILDYYPFGLQHPGQLCAPEVEPGNAYRYNGIELLEEHGLYFYGFRIYDPVVSRFTGVDPIAEEFAWVSTYNYAENEPVRNIDLHGLQKEDGWGAQLLKFLGITTGPSPSSNNSPRTSREAQEQARNRGAVQQLSDDLEVVGDGIEMVAPFAGTVRGAIDGDAGSEIATDMLVEGSLMLGGGVLTEKGLKLLRRVPAKELWLNLQTGIFQRGGTFINETMDEAGGYLKFVGKKSDSIDDNLQSGTLVPNELPQQIEIDPNDNLPWYLQILRVFDPPGDPGMKKK